MIADGKRQKKKPKERAAVFMEKLALLVIRRREVWAANSYACQDLLVHHRLRRKRRARLLGNRVSCCLINAPFTTYQYSAALSNLGGKAIFAFVCISLAQTDARRGNSSSPAITSQEDALATSTMNVLEDARYQIKNFDTVWTVSGFCWDAVTVTRQDQIRECATSGAAESPFADYRLF